MVKRHRSLCVRMTFKALLQNDKKDIFVKQSRCSLNLFGGVGQNCVSLLILANTDHTGIHRTTKVHFHTLTYEPHFHSVRESCSSNAHFDHLGRSCLIAIKKKVAVH